ncbi:hypothetical protein DL96DRAFT_1563551 [Flagelloscypha sp. PMI_526]|nr:hypothetical protein DL96DRAFT_1563551 [Flagelloscypha sp. PMI_526]
MVLAAFLSLSFTRNLSPLSLSDSFLLSSSAPDPRHGGWEVFLAKEAEARERILKKVTTTEKGAGAGIGMRLTGNKIRCMGEPDAQKRTHKSQDQNDAGGESSSDGGVPETNAEEQNSTDKECVLASKPCPHPKPRPKIAQKHIESLLLPVLQGRLLRPPLIATMSTPCQSFGEFVVSQAHYGTCNCTLNVEDFKNKISYVQAASRRDYEPLCIVKTKWREFTAAFTSLLPFTLNPSAELIHKYLDMLEDEFLVFRTIPVADVARVLVVGPLPASNHNQRTPMNFIAHKGAFWGLFSDEVIKVITEEDSSHVFGLVTFPDEDSDDVLSECELPALRTTVMVPPSLLPSTGITQEIPRTWVISREVGLQPTVSAYCGRRTNQHSKVSAYHQKRTCGYPRVSPTGSEGTSAYETEMILEPGSPIAKESYLKSKI